MDTHDYMQENCLTARDKPYWKDLVSNDQSVLQMPLNTKPQAVYFYAEKLDS